jgi:hypothetical protein
MARPDQLTFFKGNVPGIYDVLRRRRLPGSRPRIISFPMANRRPLLGTFRITIFALRDHPLHNLTTSHVPSPVPSSVPSLVPSSVPLLHPLLHPFCTLFRTPFRTL